jgi:solute:Na+ symporter, SSS family
VELEIGTFDAAVLVAYLLGVVLFGLWVGRGQRRDLSTYLLGGRNLPWWGVLLSIVATETSTVTFLSVPGLAYADGGSMVFLQLAIGYVIGRFLIVFLFLPHYFRGKLFTAYEVLHRWYGGRTKQTASALFLVTRNLADGLRLFLTAIVLMHVVKLDLSICVIAIGAATILYTVFGGMRSVVWNDCVQFVVYMIGAMLAMGVILYRLPGGWTQLSDYAAEYGKFHVFDFSFNLTSSYTFWSGLIGGLFLTLATHGTDQMMVQRYLASGSQKKAGRALAVSGFVILAQFALFLLIGVGLACFYSLNPPETPFKGNDHVFARFIVDYLPVGVVGITLAAVFAAAMSTLSSSLNASATAAVNDFYLPLCKKPPPPQRVLRVSRVLTVAFGVIQIGVGIAGQYCTQSVIGSVLTVAGFTFGPILGLFFLGVLPARVSRQAAYAGLIAGLGVLASVWMWTPLAWPWYSIVGSTTTVVVGLAANVLLGISSEANDSRNEHG